VICEFVVELVSTVDKILTDIACHAIHLLLVPGYMLESIVPLYPSAVLWQFVQYILAFFALHCC